MSSVPTIIALAAAGAGLLATFATYAALRRRSPGSPAMVALGEEIRRGAMAFLTREYGVLNMDDGSALPATFIIDPSGTVRDMCLAGPGTRRRPEGTLEALRELRMTELQAVA